MVGNLATAKMNISVMAIGTRLLLIIILNSSSGDELKLYLDHTRSTPIYTWMILFSPCICLVFKKKHDSQKSKY